ncbi:MAG: Glycosyltransferase, family 2 [uncultured Sulfurovum sp.]|uniref:Glycosyltransferase, family 2 n=1 Tax=uncultured Sulfurovum sp. TaxID=269237 RepID=A0A6S6SV78_9BACT|nr:MAG: Glycosyltransferase, family 2 [uncultured Sulfurovum sp.]
MNKIDIENRDRSPLVSVIMSVYNEPPSWLHQSITSILEQTYTHLEFIIIVDNAPNITLIDIIEKYAEDDKRIKFFINNENKGLVYSLNRALKYTTGEYIARMDADDISHTNRLERQLKYLVKNNLNLIGSNVNLFTNNNIFYTTNKLITHKYLKIMLAKGTIGIVHPTFFATKHLYESLNGYKNAIHAEDKELLARVFCKGFKVGNTAEVLLDCRYNDRSITKTNAIYVQRMGRYITDMFNSCLSSGLYEFDYSFDKNLSISQKEKENYNKAQKLMAQTRKAMNNKSYIKAVYHLINASILSSSSLSIIKVNIILKYLKFREARELRNGS